MLSCRHRNTLGMGIVGCVLWSVLMVVGCNRNAPQPVVAPVIHELAVITPHNEQIRQAFEQGFVEWMRSTQEMEVDINWIVRGTPQCVRYIEQLYTLPPEAAPRGPQPDVLFGGGIADHSRLAAEGWSRFLDLGELVAAIPPRVNGLPTRDEQGHWYGTGLTGFGILCNTRACQERGIAPPTSWADLGDPRFFGWLGIAAPGQSGSNRECMMLIVQQHGWNEGWGVIMRILGNTRGLGQRSSIVLDHVETGVFLAAFAVNFDAQARVERNPDTLTYIAPPKGTAVTPDLISVLAKSPHADLAEQFVRFTLSEPGQLLWGARQEYFPPLYHYPIQPAVYADHGDRLLTKGNPLAEPMGQQLDATTSSQHAQALVPLVAAAAEHHLLLERAWRSLIEAGLPAGALAGFTQPVVDEATAIAAGEAYARDEEEAATTIQQWAELFKEKYSKVLTDTKP